MGIKSFYNRKILVGIVALAAMLTLMLTGCNNASSESVKDGEYSLNASLIGGSGKATIKSPAKAEAINGVITVLIEWSSPNYDYMIVDGQKYLPINTDGNSVFSIPIKSLDCSISVIADTVAMSKPHEIEYDISFSLAGDTNENVQHKPQNENNKKEVDSDVTEWTMRHSVTDELELKYANEYSVKTYDNKYCVLEINETDYYLIMDDMDNVPSDLPDGFNIITKPVDKIYIVSTASFDYFSSLNALDNVLFTSFKKEDVDDDELLSYMNAGKIKYAGKYSAPDYETIISDGCNLVIENTMILHAPDVLNQFKNLGVNTLVDYSSHESNPLGRMEWIKLYGLLTNKTEEAERIFSEKEEMLIKPFEKTGKKVAYFYITNNGGVVIRKNQDYISKIIEMAGGTYIYNGLDKYDGTGTMTVQKEAFFESVTDCDYLIYNSTIDGGVESVDELISKCEILKNTKAYRDGNIYCTSKNVYQSVMQLPEIISDINSALTDRNDLVYLNKLE